MNTSVLIAFIAALLFETCYSESSSTGPHITPKIINGTVAKTHQVKFQVSLRVLRKVAFRHICGGALIGPDKVLTAAHCLYKHRLKVFYEPHECLIVMGTLKLYRSTKENIIASNVSSIALTGRYNPDEVRDDIAVMFLTNGLEYYPGNPNVAPIELSNEAVSVGASCQISGWGLTEEEVMSNDLLVANVSIISRRSCSGACGLFIPEGMICAGHWEGGSDSCAGDSGGPLVYINKVVGIVSWGVGCGAKEQPGVYTDVQYYYDWIMSLNRGIKIKKSLLISCIIVLVLNILN